MLNETLFIGILIFGILLVIEFHWIIFSFANFMVYLLNGRRESQNSKTEFHLEKHLEDYPKLKYQKMNVQKEKLEVLIVGVRYCIFKGIFPILWGLIQGLGWAVIFLAIPNDADLKMITVIFFFCIFILCLVMWIRVLFFPNKLKQAIYIQFCVFLAYIFFDNIVHSSISLEETNLYLNLYFWIYLLFNLLQIYIKKGITNQRKFIYQTFIKYWYLREKEYRVTDKYSNRFNVRKKSMTEKWCFKYWPISIHIQKKRKYGYLQLKK